MHKTISNNLVRRKFSYSGI